MDNASVSKKGNMNDKKEYPTAAKLAPSDLRRSRHLLVLRPAGGGVHGDERHRKPLNSFTRHKARLFPRKSGAVR